MIVIVYDGLSKPHTPGSLHEMAVSLSFFCNMQSKLTNILFEYQDTTILPETWMTVPMSFGLIMAGFAGHAVFPTIYRDMKNPKQYKQMVNYTYIVTASVYMTVAASGYAMFGSGTMQEVK